MKDNEILNPKTKRYVKRDTKKGIEILFNQKDNEILKLYELVDGKIVKKCEKDKIRNLKTKRCVKNKEIKKDKSNDLNKKIEGIKIDKSNDLNKKIEAIKKVKKALIPFKNRVSADIYHRNRYLVLMRRELKNKKDGCMKVYKENLNGTYSYRIGNRIILNKRIGSNSVYGIVYLSEFREKNKKLFTFASKVYRYDDYKTSNEIKLLIKFTNIVRMDLCPHFPIFYGHVMCENLIKFKKDSFKKSNTNDKTISQRITKYPSFFQDKNPNFPHYKNPYKIITTFNELANGDLWNFFRINIKNSNYLTNALIQQLISIIFFNYYSGRIHNDTHPGNFLYHKIKAGGYFHYKLFGRDYYLENIGFLWVIWDFDLSILVKRLIQFNNRKNNNNTDFKRIICAYLTEDDDGYNPYIEIEENKELREYILKIMKGYELIYNSKYNIEKLKKLIYELPEIISVIKFNGKSVLLKSLPLGEKIINKNPYTINREELFK
jgi:hypothetical protein